MRSLSLSLSLWLAHHAGTYPKRNGQNGEERKLSQRMKHVRKRKTDLSAARRTLLERLPDWSWGQTLNARRRLVRVLLRRLRCKTTLTGQAAQQRLQCQLMYASGQLRKQRAHARAEAKWHCKHHKRMMGGSQLAIFCLLEHEDKMVPTHERQAISDNRCKHRRALHFPEERVGQPPHLSFCCRQGKLKRIPTVTEAPLELQDLLTGTSRSACGLRGNIRAYNGALASVSFGLNCFENVAVRGLPVARCHGSVYHVAGHILSSCHGLGLYLSLSLSHGFWWMHHHAL